MEVVRKTLAVLNWIIQYPHGKIFEINERACREMVIERRRLEQLREEERRIEAELNATKKRIVALRAKP